jgi:drug/metabolite transporter (DMT)-like permease
MELGAMKRQEFGALVLLAAIWGMSFLLIRIAAPKLGPLTLVTARMLIAGGILLLYVISTRRQRPDLRQFWKAYLVLGLLNSVLPLSLETFAVLHLPASLVAILLTAVPLFTALASAMWLREQLTGAKLAGLLLGLLGVGALVGWSRLPLTRMVVLAIGAVLLAAVFYALASIYAKVTFRGTSALSLTIGQELVAGTIMLPLALVSPPAAPPSLTVVAAVIVLGLVMTAGGNLLYFYLLDHVGPTKTQSVAFLIPVFALLASMVFLGEPVTGGTLLGLGIILAGVGLVIEVRMRLPRMGLRAALLSQPALPSDAILLDSAKVPTASRLSGALFVDRALVYDRYSTRRDSHERRPAMCI